MSSRLIKTRFIAPYSAAGKTNLAFCERFAGVYIIKNNRGVITYIGYSASNLYKTITRHFQSWKDKAQVRVTYPQTAGYTVRVVITTPERAAALEKALIVKYKPTDNPNKLALYSPTKYETAVMGWYEEEPVIPVAKHSTLPDEAPF